MIRFLKMVVMRSVEMAAVTRWTTMFDYNVRSEVTADVEMAAAGIGVVGNWFSLLWFVSFSPTKNMHIIQV